MFTYGWTTIKFIINVNRPSNDFGQIFSKEPLTICMAGSDKGGPLNE